MMILRSNGNEQMVNGYIFCIMGNDNTAMADYPRLKEVA